MNAIRVEKLTKSYDGKPAVQGIDLEVSQGEIFGLLGPNGAGKTTTVEMIEGLRDPDSGTIHILGEDVRKTSSKVKNQIGVALQSTSLMRNLTPFEMLQLFGSFYPTAVDPDVLLKRLGLQEKRNSKVQDLSGGQSQRLCVALALVNEPKLVFLDEPTTGLDPQARRSLWEVINDIRNDGKTVILTTHYMEEAEHLCDRIAIMDHGKFLALDTPKGLIETHFHEKTVTFTPPAGRTAEEYADLPGVTKATDDNDEVVLLSNSVQATLSSLLDRADKAGEILGDVHLRRASLEDVFLKLTGRRIRE